MGGDVNLLMQIGYTLGVLLIVPFVACYGVVTAITGAIEGAAVLIWDVWK